MDPLLRKIRDARRRLFLAQLGRELAGRSVLLLAAILLAAALDRWLGWHSLAWISAGSAIALLAELLLRPRWPSSLAAAIALDAQWHLGERLSSALLIAKRPPASSPFIDAVRADAQLAAERLPLRNLQTGGFGLPMWILTLFLAGLWPVIHGPAAAAPTDALMASAHAAAPSSPAASARKPAATPQPADRPGVPSGETDDHSAFADPALASAPGRPADRLAESDGTGFSPGGPTRSPDAPEIPNPSPARTTPGDQPASGDGPASAIAADDHPTQGKAVSPSIPGRDAPLGQSPLPAGAPSPRAPIPPEYGDILKAYFAR